MKYNFSIKRNEYNVKGESLKKYKITPLNLIFKVVKPSKKLSCEDKNLSVYKLSFC